MHFDKYEASALKKMFEYYDTCGDSLSVSEIIGAIRFCLLVDEFVVTDNYSNADFIKNKIADMVGVGE